MDLYLLRHAEAGEAPRDEERELTEHGQVQARAAAAGILWLELGLGAVLSSPLPRATQTAEPVARALGISLETAQALATGRSPAEGLALLAGHAEPILLVGHEPQLSRIALAVTGGRVRLRKAMLLCLELLSDDPPQGELAWLLSWKHLKRLGRS
jgi:phosphohistidine phosphatase SixA